MGGKKKQTIGYRYHTGMHLTVCRGVIDKVLKLRYGDKTAWRGTSVGETIEVTQPDLFGGDSSGGGIQGKFDVLIGTPTQERNAYLLGILGPLVSAFRGVFSLVARQVYWGTSEYIKNLAITCQRIFKKADGSEQWYAAKAGIEGEGSYYVGLDVDWEMLGNSEGVVTYCPAPQVTTFVSPDGEPKTVAIRVTGTVELRTYPGGEAVSEHVTLGGTPGPNANYNIYSLEISSPPAVYYMNTGTSTPTLTAIDETFSVTINNGATITVSALPIDGKMIGTRQTLVTSVNDDYRFNDMNPAHIIRECITDTEGGLGYLDADVDDVSFTAAADVLYAEGFGLSFAWEMDGSVEEFVRDVQAHIDARTYVHPRTGKWTLKLIRADYDVDDLPVLGPEQISRVSDFARPLSDERSNSVAVKYWSSRTQSDACLSVDDPALVQQQGKVICATREYPGITKASLAAKVARRDLKVLSASLLSAKLYCNRSASMLLPGDAFVLNWPDLDITGTVCRVDKVELGDAASGEVIVSIVEDVFSLDSTVVIGSEPSDWSDPNGQPPAASAPFAVEAPYYELVQRYGESAVANILAETPDAGMVLLTGSRPANAVNADGYIDGAELRERVDFSPSGSLTAAAAMLATSAAITWANGLEPGTGTHIQIGDELVRYDGSGNIARGVLDTVPVSHDAGAKVWAWDVFATTDEIARPEGEDVPAYLYSRGVSMRGPKSPTVNVTMGARAIRPYPPGNFKINGEYFPATVTADRLDFTWAHRDRTQQTAAPLLSFTDGSVGPETGTTYNVRIYSESNALLSNNTGVTGSSLSVPIPSSGTVEYSPVNMAFSKVVDAPYDVKLPSALTDVVETFTTNSGQITHYDYGSPGTYGLSGGKYVITHTGSTSMHDIFAINTVSYSMPCIWTESEISVSGSAGGYNNGGVGIVKDASNFLMAIAQLTQNAIRIEARIAGTTTFLGDVAFTMPTSFKLGLALVGNSATAYIDTGSGWQYVTGTSVATYYDFRTVGNLVGWKPGSFFASNGGTTTWSFDNLKSGRFGGVGIRDQTLVTNEDGTPYRPTPTTVLFTATLPDHRGTAYAGVFSLNLNTYAITQVAALMVERSGKVYNDLAPHIIYYSNGNRRITISTWANGFGNSLQVLHKLETADLLSGTRVVSGMTQLNLPGQTGTNPGAYDSMLAYDSAHSRWLIAYSLTEDTSFTGNPFYPAAAYSSNLTSWTLIGKDDTHKGYEGTKLVKTNSDYWIVAGGPAGASTGGRIYNSSMVYQGALNATLEGGTATQPHPMIFAYNNSQILLTYDDTKDGTGNFTWGNLLIYTSDRFAPVTSSYRVELESERDGWTSWQKYSHVFSATGSGGTGWTSINELGKSVWYPVKVGGTLYGMWQGIFGTPQSQRVVAQDVASGATSYVSGSLATGQTSSLLYANSSVYLACFDASGNNLPADLGTAYVKKVNPATGDVVSWSAPTGELISDLGWDGTYLWSYGLKDGALRKHDAATLAVLSSYVAPTLGGIGAGGSMAWLDGKAYIKSAVGDVSCYDPTSGSVLWTTYTATTISKVIAKGSVIITVPQSIYGNVWVIDATTGASVKVYNDGCYDIGHQAVGASSMFAYRKTSGGLIYWLSNSDGSELISKSLPAGDGKFTAGFDDALVTNYSDTESTGRTWIYNFDV